MYNPVGSVLGWRQAECTVGTHNSGWAIREGFLEDMTPEVSVRE